MTFSLNIRDGGYSSIPDGDGSRPHAEAEKPPRFHRAHAAALATGLLALIAVAHATNPRSRIPANAAPPPPPPPPPPPTTTTTTTSTSTSPENEPHFYDGQLVDHLGVGSASLPTHWRHRYYMSTEHFGGPGHPILLVVGGEGALNDGMLYPYVTHDLAVRFGAAVVQPEHRFYGPYQPLGPRPSVADRLDVFTPRQAMEDALRLVTVHLRGPGMPLDGCSPLRSSPDYCPLVAVGASYPGFLSAMLRLVRGDVVDASYASSAPLLMYAQEADDRAYYDIVTRAADRSSPGCASAVRTALDEAGRTIADSPSLIDAAKAVGVCAGEGGELLPRSFATKEDLADAINLLAVYGFANNDMGVYPPGPTNAMYKVCRSFQDVAVVADAAGSSPPVPAGTLGAYFREQALADYEDANGCDGGARPPARCDDEEKVSYLAGLFGGGCTDMRPDFEEDAAAAAAAGGGGGGTRRSTGSRTTTASLGSSRLAPTLYSSPGLGTRACSPSTWRRTASSRGTAAIGSVQASASPGRRS